MVRKEAFKLVLKSVLQSGAYILLFYYWMRLLKHKGKKDFIFMGLMSLFISLGAFNRQCYNFLLSVPFPTHVSDLERRKEVVEEFVFSSNRPAVLTEEIKKLSKELFFEEKIEMDYVTSLTKTRITFTAWKGRLYLSSGNYAELFGVKNLNARAQPKISELNVYNTRERDIIFGLFKFYDFLIDKYKRENGIAERESLKKEQFRKLLEKGKVKDEVLRNLDGLGDQAALELKRTAQESPTSERHEGAEPKKTTEIKRLFKYLF